MRKPYAIGLCDNSTFSLWAFHKLEKLNLAKFAYDGSQDQASFHFFPSYLKNGTTFKNDQNNHLDSLNKIRDLL